MWETHPRKPAQQGLVEQIAELLRTAGIVHCATRGRHLGWMAESCIGFVQDVEGDADEHDRVDQRRENLHAVKAVGILRRRRTLRVGVETRTSPERGYWYLKRSCSRAVL